MPEIEKCKALEAQLLAAHAKQDHNALVDLYTLAGDRAENNGDINAACFFLTQAFVFALEQDHQETYALNQRLVAHGRANSIPDPKC